MRRVSAAQRETQLTDALVAWFSAHARSLPWRSWVCGQAAAKAKAAPKKRVATAKTPNTKTTKWPTRDPYVALVSEAMLQQTQVSRVAERLPLFVKRFPTVDALANADEHDVLAMWSGLGYYRRARNLHAAAQAIVAQHNGDVPSAVDELLALPGVGRYTAGAIASIVFNTRAPIVDANVARVLLRLEGNDAPPDSSATVAWVWERAETLVRATGDPSACNEGLMELGALVCTPKSPACGVCPWQMQCKAFKAGKQGEIPAPKQRTTARKVVHHAAVIVRDAQGRVLAERRPEKGLWAGMWQAPTLERTERAPAKRTIASWAGVQTLARVDGFTHLTSHREVRFTVWEASSAGSLLDGHGAKKGVAREKTGVSAGSARIGQRQWMAVSDLADAALSSPHRRILVPVE